MTREKVLAKMRELLNDNEVDFENISISNYENHYEISRMIDLNNDEKVVLHSVKEKDDKFEKISRLVCYIWMIEFMENDIESILTA